ncbi:MAG: elongation factor G [Candidatus Omnitrophota bacterium]
MAELDVKNIRTLGLFSHSSAGKTSLAEAVLHACKMTTRLGNVMQGNTVSDYNPDEIERKISISAKPLFADYKGQRIYIIDTPGYADFFGEVINASRAIDAGILLIDGIAGIEVGTERAWKTLEAAKTPKLVFVNKLDKENADFYKVLEALGKRFQKRFVVLTAPVGIAAQFKGVVNLLSGDLSSLGAAKEKAETLKRELIEAASESDDALLEKYLEGKELTPEEINKGLRKGILEDKIVLVVCGSATQSVGVAELLDAIVEFLPSPLDMPARTALNPKNKEEKKEIPPTEAAPFSAYVFKTISDPYVGQLTLFRVYSGKLASSDSNFYNSTKQIKEKFGQIILLQGKEQITVPLVKAGEIAAIAKLKDTSTCDTICDEKNAVVFEASKFPESAISASVKPHSKQDEEKIMGALQRLNVEDPTFKVTRDAQTKELIVSGMGDLHLDIMVERLKKRFGVGVDMGTPKVPYKETIKSKVSVQGKYKKQSGGRGQYGDCWLEVEPLADTDFEFVDKIVGGAIPRNYIPSVEKGVHDAMQQGILAGYPVCNIRVTLYDGSFHPVDSSDMAFQIAGSMAFKKAQEQAKPVLLEPIMEVDVIVPDDYMGQITGDLNSRRGRILGMEPSGSMQAVKATVPLAEMFKYASELRSMTGGRGTYTMRFSRYEEVPGKITQQVIDQLKKQAEQHEKK